jgi:hypothetical protein
MSRDAGRNDAETAIGDASEADRETRAPKRMWADGPRQERGVTAPVSDDQGHRRPPRAVAGLAWLLGGASLTLSVLGLVLESLNGHLITDTSVVGIALLAIAFPLAGAVVAARRPHNPLGWIFCAIGVLYGLTVTGEAYGIYTLRTAPGSLPGGGLMSWLGNWAWAPALGLLMTFALLLFPDGRLPSRRWRPVAWLSALSIAMTCGPGAVWSWPQRGLALLESNQEGLENAPRLVGPLVLAGYPLMLVCGLASVVALLVRFRRSRGVERQQLKWFTFAGAVTFASLVLIVTPSQAGWIGPVNPLVSLPRPCVDARRRGRRDPSVPAVRDRPAHQPHPGLWPTDSRPRTWLCRCRARTRAALRRGDQRTAELGDRRRHLGRGGAVPAGPAPHPSAGGSALQPTPLQRGQDDRGV